MFGAIRLAIAPQEADLQRAVAHRDRVGIVRVIRFAHESSTVSPPRRPPAISCRPSNETPTTFVLKALDDSIPAYGSRAR